MQTYAIATLGCKVNQYEGETLKGQLSQLVPVAFGQPADLYIINTCSVTAEAEAKARQLIGRARRGAPGALVVLTGCWRDVETENLKTLGVDLFFNNSEKQDLLKRLPLKLDTRPAGSTAKASSRTRLVVKVQDGCDESCAYCAIPGFRDRLISRPKAEIVREIDRGVDAGANEVVLTGIHLGKYGVDLSGDPSLTEVINGILDKTSLKRLRLSSIEPQEITDELIGLMASTTRLARHLHIPLQSGSDTILRSMNRRYRSADYLEL
ncbi:MAG TPA: radical SAM protein, partial [Actinobacteria bacterium]|nr:radical SAM protein [Actinomycetota bacterium]